MSGRTLSFAFAGTPAADQRRGVIVRTQRALRLVLGILMATVASLGLVGCTPSLGSSTTSSAAAASPGLLIDNYLRVSARAYQSSDLSLLGTIMSGRAYNAAAGQIQELAQSGEQRVRVVERVGQVIVLSARGDPVLVVAIIRVVSDQVTKGGAFVRLMFAPGQQEVEYRLQAAQGGGDAVIDACVRTPPTLPPPSQPVVQFTQCDLMTYPW